MSEEKIGNRMAKEGNVFVCCACGKTSKWKYGFDKEGNQIVDGERIASPGWDVSCMMNCDEFSKDKLVFKNGLVIKIED